MTIVKTSADKVEGYDGYTSFRFRSDVAPDYNALYEAVHERGGAITSAGSLRSLRAKVSYGRVSTSLHYTGVAFDMSIYAGGNNPDHDPMVLVEDRELGPRRWRVWFRSSVEFVGTQTLLPVEERTLQAVKLNGKRQRTTQQTNGYFFDFTALAWEKGWTGIPAWRTTWDGTGGYSGNEFWHFQCKSCIADNEKFGTVLKKMYAKSRIIAAFGNRRWTKSKNRRFTGRGFR